MDKKTKIILAAAAAVLLCVIGGAYLYIQSLKEANDILIEQFAIEKEELQDEYTQLAIDYEGYKLNVNNDSLEQKLEDQRLKIQRLVEELRQTKVEDARKIAALKKELETVRGVLRYYVSQVDSLNKVNAELKTENQQVMRQIQNVRKDNSSLMQQNEKLNQKVSLAAQLTITGLNATGLSKRNRATTSIKQLKDIRISFSIAANVTAATGEKDIYLRILRPDEDLLVNSRSGMFQYEGSSVQYSTKKTIEYGGEETAVSLFWNVAETLSPGTYRMEIYADGACIGRTSLKLEK